MMQRISITLVAAAMFVSTALCCCPDPSDDPFGGIFSQIDPRCAAAGYIEEYLGLTLISDMSTGSNGEYIQSASDLTCNLDFLSTCRWKNLENTANVFIDTEDFYYFGQTNEVAQAFSLLAPPGRTPAAGSKVILGGSQTANAAAVWHSDPIMCMQNDGTLSFEYWLLNYFGSTPSIEVILLDPVTFVPLYTSTETCDAATPTDGICTVNIPAQTDAFSIGIRVYNLNTNFVIIDNIQFAATFGAMCDGSLDFGTTSTGVTFGGTDTAITDAAQLNCAEFDATCRWSNDGDEPQWATHTGSVDPAKWTAATGKWPTPAGDFLMVQAPAGSADAALYGDTIACQSGPGTLTFNAWMSTGVSMKACVVDSTDLITVKQCHTVLRDAWGSPLYNFVFNGPIDNAKVQIVVDDWGTDGGMAAVDDIRYVAPICEPQTDATLISGPFTTTEPYLGILPPTTVTSSAELACTSDTATSCHWGKAMEEHNWLWVDNVDTNKLQQLSKTSLVPTGGAAYYEFPEPGYTFFASDEMHCVNTDGDLTFTLWTSDNVELEICAILPTEARERCHPKTLEASGQKSYKFFAADVGYHPISFIVTAHLTSGTTGFIMLDDLAFNGGVCAVPHTTDPDPTTPDELECQLFSASFSVPGALGAVWHSRTEDLPGLRKTYTPTEFKEISNSIGRQNRVIDGADNGAPYAGVEMTGAAPVAVLTSESMLFEQDHYMSFTYQRGLSHVKIYVCHNEIPRITVHSFTTQDTECDLIADYYNFTGYEFLDGARGGTIVKASDSKIHIVAVYASTGTEAPVIIDDIRFHQGTTADSPYLCEPLG